MKITVEEILQEVEKLSLEDLRKLLTLIDSLLEEKSEKTVEEGK